MLFIASSADVRLAVGAVELRCQRRHRERVVVERVVEQHRLVAAVSVGVGPVLGVDLHADWPEFGDRVVVQVEVDRLTAETAANRETAGRAGQQTRAGLRVGKDRGVREAVQVGIGDGEHHRRVELRRRPGVAGLLDQPEPSAARIDDSAALDLDPAHVPDVGVVDQASLEGDRSGRTRSASCPPM